MKGKIRVLLFARSFLAIYYSDIKSEIIEPIFVTLTHKEKLYLESKGWLVYGCFEDDYEALPIAKFEGNYLKTSLKSDRFLCRFKHDKRMEILGKEISFWSHIMDTTRPSFLVNETVALEIAEVMAIEAEKREIPFHTYLLGFIPGTFYWKPDPFSGRMQNMNTIQPSETDKQKAEEYINGVIEKDNRPFYVSNVQKQNITLKTVLHSWWLNIIIGGKNKKLELKMAFKYEDYSLLTEKDMNTYFSCLFNKYDDISTIDEKKIIFYPMHLEPEAILSYFVEENYDQSMIINSILSCIKQDQYLVVKEHPQQQGVLLTSKYREIKKRNSNVIYLPSYIKSFPIIKKSDAIVTLTSTVAWEALIMGKPSFVLGKIFYDQCLGVVRIESFKQLKKELRMLEYPKPNVETTKDYAAKMISMFKNGCPSPMFSANTSELFIKAIEDLT